MGGLFSKNKKVKTIDERDKVVLQLKTQRDLLNRKLKKYDTDVKTLEKLAKDCVKEKKKDKAILVLRRKRFLEKRVSELDKQLDQIENMTTQLEFTQMEMQVVENLEKGNQVLTDLHKILTIGDVERIMEETQAGIEQQQEIDDILSQGLSQDDDEAVDKEFNDMFEVDLSNLPEPNFEIEEEDKDKETNMEGDRQKDKQKQKHKETERVALEAS